METIRFPDPYPEGTISTVEHDRQMRRMEERLDMWVDKYTKLEEANAEVRGFVWELVYAIDNKTFIAPERLHLIKERMRARFAD